MYKTGDLLYHDHEHGPECTKPGSLDAAAHFSEFHSSRVRVAVLIQQDGDVWDDSGYYEIGGVDEVRALISDLQQLAQNMSPLRQAERDVSSDRRDIATRRELLGLGLHDRVQCAARRTARVGVRGSSPPNNQLRGQRRESVLIELFAKAGITLTFHGEAV